MFDERRILCHFQLFIALADLNLAGRNLFKKRGMIPMQFVQLKNSAIQKQADGSETQTDYKNFEWITKQTHAPKSKTGASKELASFKLA